MGHIKPLLQITGGGEKTTIVANIEFDDFDEALEFQGIIVKFLADHMRSEASLPPTNSADPYDRVATANAFEQGIEADTDRLGEIAKRQREA